MKQDERDELLIRLDEKTYDMRKDIKDIKEILFGNGKEGLCYVITKHKVYFSLLGIAIALLVGKVTIL